MDTAKFAVKGLDCNSCAKTVEALLRLEPGVQTIMIAGDTEQVTVLFDPARSSAAALLLAIKDGGYRAELAS